MNPRQAATILDKMLDPPCRCLDAGSSQRVADYRIDPEVQARLDDLAERANEGQLTEAERSEYLEYIDVGDFIAILQLKVRSLHNSNGTA